QELETGRVDSTRRSQDGQTLTSSGSLHSSRVRIVDPETATERAPGEVGEIWVRGPSVACGYWNQPAISRETFHAHTKAGDGPFLRTGDLGVALEDQLFVTGRLKDLIIIRGRNLYPHDLEAVVSRSHPSLEPDHAIAFGFDSPDGEALAIVVEASRGR